MKLELKRICIQYDQKSPLINGVDLTINSVDFVVIQGPSGSGKSSLLRVMNQLQCQTEGDIWFNGRPIDADRVPLYRRQVGYVQQIPVMFPGSVLHNLQYPFRLRTADKNNRPSNIELRRQLDAFLLADVDLTTDAITLSVGQKQRIALIRTMLLKPRVLLCDEPTSALDTESREFVEKWLIANNRNQAISIVLVTHFPFHLHQAARRFTLKNGILEEG